MITGRDFWAILRQAQRKAGVPPDPLLKDRKEGVYGKARKP